MVVAQALEVPKNHPALRIVSVDFDGRIYHGPGLAEIPFR